MSGGELHFLMFYYSIIFAGNVNLSLGEVAFITFPIFPPDIMLDLTHSLGFPGGSDGKESACNAGDPCSIPGLGISPGGGSATHSSILAWRIPRAEEPGRLQSMESRRVGHN